eukprot:scaffold2079_cov142-Skeletonema_marinoi.AAC.10
MRSGSSNKRMIESADAFCNSGRSRHAGAEVIERRSEVMKGCLFLYLTRMCRYCDSDESMMLTFDA